MLGKLKQKFVSWLLRGVHLDELRIGEHSVVISGTGANMDGQKIENVAAPDSDDDVPRRDTIDNKIATHAGDPDIHHTNLADITFVIDGGGSAITTGQKGHLEIPFACTIQQVTMEADQSGSIVVDIWKDIYANFPPTDADSITAAAPPTISAAQKSQDSTLTGWTTSIAAGDILAFNCDSCTSITRLTISLKVAKS